MNPMPRFRTNKGFTMVEMVVTVAVLAILVSLSMPAIYDYIRFRDQQREEVALNEIHKALEAHLAAKGTLPAETTTGTNAWYNVLAGYTSMPADDIKNDVYGRARTYVRYHNIDGRSMNNTPVRIYYATVHSMGANGYAENKYKNASGSTVTIPGISIDTSTNPDSFKASSDGAWWKAQVGSGSTAQLKADSVVSSFGGLRPGGDDHLMRFTNYTDVLERYKLTTQRLDTLSQALETYARSRYAERVAGCVTTPTSSNCTGGVPEKTIYYPRSLPSAAETEVLSGSNRNVIYYSTNQIVDNGASIATRRTQMQSLMDILGLPRDNCCSALTDEPFFYFSNPRPRTTGGCGSRPRSIGTTVEEQKLPARVTTVNDSTTCG
ncbi:MAG: type II secretion system protein [Alphaproteobacteria bacterium]|nr:MAG: type II secretion system protein [Alphaproteobacteria bacterium]